MRIEEPYSTGSSFFVLLFSGEWLQFMSASVADPHHVDADPDPTFYSYADPDPDPTFQFNVESEPMYNSHFPDLNPPVLPNDPLWLPHFQIITFF